MDKTKFGEFEYTEEELRKQFEEATKRADEADRSEPRAAAAYYDDNTNRVVVDLVTGVTVSFPPDLLQGLEDASPTDLAEVHVSPQGTSLHWEKLDADFSIPSLIAGVFGTRAWMADLGRRGGRATSNAKAAAARANGRKGGRPRKPPAKPTTFGAKQEQHALDMSVFEAMMTGGVDFWPGHIPRVLLNVSHFPPKVLDKVMQKLDEDIEAFTASEIRQGFEGQMMWHHAPAVAKEILIQENTQKYRAADIMILDFVG